MTRSALTLLAFAAVTGCSGVVENDTLGTRPDPAGGSQFRTYAAIGTSLSAGFQSGGINDSTQREGPATQLAMAMGLTPGVDWSYPSFRYPGCPAPYTNILTGARVNGTNVTTNPCFTRNVSSAVADMNNVAIPGLRAAQAVNITTLDFPTDTLKLATFVTGGLNPLDVVAGQVPTFVTVEVGANDVLAAATRGDPALLTPLASFQASIAAIADRLDALSPRPNVAIANVPNVSRIPFFTAAQVIFCLRSGACPGIPITPPFNSPLFSLDASCAPAPGIGGQYLLSFNATGALVSTLANGRAARLNCAADSLFIATAAPPAAPSVSAGPTLNATETAAIVTRVGEFNTAIASLATARNYALVNLDSALGANAALIPPIPQFPAPPATGNPNLMGPLFSQDGVHPNKAGYRLMAQTFAAAINARFGSSLTIP